MEHLICNLSTLMFDHSEEEGQEIPHIYYATTYPTSPSCCKALLLRCATLKDIQG